MDSSATKAVLNVFSGWHSCDRQNEGSLVARGWFGVGIGRGWWFQAIIVDDVVKCPFRWLKMHFCQRFLCHMEK